MQKISSYLPLVITIAGGLFIGILAIIRLIAEPWGITKILACSTVTIYILWKVLESKITVSETKKGENNDKGTVELCAAVEISLLAAVFTCSGNVHLLPAIVGIVIMHTGLLIRFTAIAALGESYSLRIRQIEKGVVNKGPYKYIRHPSYLGTIIVHTGLVFVFPGLLPFFLLALWYIAVTVRAITEDRFLKKDENYNQYSNKTSRMLFPGIL